MSTTTTKVPMGQKIAFGFGMLANQMFPAILGIFMVVLVQDLGFPGWMWGIIYFFPRIFDSFTDPIMGFISDNTKSKWGRRRQYVFAGAIIMGIAFVIMWQLYKIDGLNYNFAYFMFWSFIFYLGLTIFSVPYVAMGYEMSNDFHERTNIMAIAQWIGQWAWVIAPWFWVIMYDPEWFPSADVATRTLAIWIGAALMIIAIIPAVFIKSKSTLNENYSELSLKNIGSSFNEIILGFKEALKIEPFRRLCISTFFIFNAFNTVATFTFFVVVYHLFNGDTVAAGIWPTLFGSLGALSTTFLVIPIVTWMSKKIGKTNAFIWSQAISIIGYIMLWFLFVPGKPYLFIFALPFFSFGIGSLFTLMMSMTSDVIDLDELNSGKRREGIFGAIYWWMVKFGFAIAGGLSGVIIWLVGFQEGVPGVEQESAITGLRIFFSGLPILGTLIAIYVMRGYDVTEEKAMKTQAILAKRKAKKTTVGSGYGEYNVMSGFHLEGVSRKELLSLVPSYFNSPIDWKGISKSDLQSHFTESFEKGMHGICFSPFREGQNPGNPISERQIRERLEVLKPHTKWIRVFSCTNGHEKIPAIAKEMGFNVLMGAWIDGDEEQNNREIQALISLIESGNVDMASVGNEVLFRGELNEDKIINYIKRVKEKANGIPVGCVEVYYEFINRPRLAEVADVVMINCYPFWEGSNIEYASLYLQEMYRKTAEAVGRKKIMITETGWPSKGEVINAAVPSKDNTMKYYLDIQSWAKHSDVELFYFSSFDESWKIHFEGWAGTSWGLWDAEEKFKY